MTSRIRVVSYNIAKGASLFGTKMRLDGVRLALHTLNADVVCLQEVQNHNTRRFANSSQLDTLATIGLEHSAYGANKHYPHGHHGNAILSKQPITAQHNLDLSVRKVERRGLLHTELMLNHRPLHVLSTHFSLMARDRLEQAKALIDYVETHIPADAALVLAGDFNDWHRRVDQHLRRSLHPIQEVFDHAHSLPARTFPSLFPVLRLDRIYVRNLMVAHAQVPTGRVWAGQSDHRPIVADLLWS